MFTAVWMLYAADRLLDARPLPNGTPPPELEERHRFHQRHRKAFLSAIVVASGALAALLDRLDPRALHLYALLATLLAAVCTLNCLFLYAWEHPAPRLQAHWTTRWATGHLRALATAVTAAAALTASLSALHRLPRLDTAPAVACALSAALLQALDSHRSRFTPLTMRASADLVLLTPLALMALSLS
jgi:hypothetical protein